MEKANYSKKNRGKVIEKVNEVHETQPLGFVWMYKESERKE